MHPETIDINNKRSSLHFELLPFVAVLAIALAFPLACSTISMQEGFNIVSLLLFFYFIGGTLLFNLPARLHLPSVFTAGLSVLTGATVLFVLLPFGFLSGNNAWIFATADVVIIAFLVYCKSISVSRLTVTDLVVAVVCVFSLLINENITELGSRYPLLRTDGMMDNYWFTAMTASLRDGDFKNTLFESGVGVYHHVLGDIPAATLAELGSIPTHVALWGITVPLGCFLAFYSIYVLAAWFVPKLGHTPWMQVLLFIVVYFLMPLNPKYILRFDAGKILWNTEAHTLPFQPTWNMVYIISAITFLYIFRGLVQRTKDILLIAGLVVLMILAKVTSFVVLGSILGCYSLYLAFKIKNYKPLAGLLLGAGISMLLVKFFFGNSSLKFIISPGFLLSYMNEHSGRGGSTSLATYGTGFIVFIALMLTWHHWLILGVYYLPKLQAGFSRKSFIVSLLVALLACFTVANLFRIQSLGENNEVLIDSSFDLLQFFRSYFVFLCTFGSIGILILLSGRQRSLVRRALKWLCIVWIGLCACVVAYKEFTGKDKPGIRPVSWHKEVSDEAKGISFGKLIAQSDSIYSGQVLSAHDVGPWHLSIRDRQGGYTFSNRHRREFDALDSLLKPGGTINSDSLLRAFRQNGVDYFIASPRNLSVAEELSKKGLLIDLPGAKWFFKLR